ncbi:MAG TPA: hypothetical protein VF331_00265 [Polyangiales bacterium]
MHRVPACLACLACLFGLTCPLVPCTGRAQEAAAAADSGSSEELMLNPATGDELAAPDSATEPPSHTDAASTRATRAETLRALLARYAQEPSVNEVVQAALRVAAGDPQRFASLTRRARLRGLVPTLELGARRGQGIDLRTAAQSSIDAVQLKTDDSLVLEATLRLELGRLLFAPEEIGIAREARWDRRARLSVVRDVVRLYFLRKRLLLERDLRGSTDIDHEVRIGEAEALLDAFTNGAFQRMMVARRSAWKTAANTSASTPR